ncbi:hypothetical protein SAMN05443144_11222 [Fodinibius roseus]|uniref:Uncharacterized protein n=1 Tax=Fodinibius roseus TaxID=1194090 RepID=A0A1M5DSZ8_9BACT|nr:hypothetical protein SAMN05443144_11222 [Fodinibius roseus]
MYLGHVIFFNEVHGSISQPIATALNFELYVLFDRSINSNGLLFNCYYFVNNPGLLSLHYYRNSDLIKLLDFFEIYFRKKGNVLSPFANLFFYALGGMVNKILHPPFGNLHHIGNFLIVQPLMQSQYKRFFLPLRQ